MLKGEADVAVASLSITAEARRRLDFTAPYYRTPGRFAVNKSLAEGAPQAVLKAKRVAVVAGSAHEAFLRAFFPALQLAPAGDLESAQRLLARAEADAVFADGIALAFWLNGANSQDCCKFIGGPYLEPRYFGEGVGMALRPDEEGLRRALDYALQRVWDSGVYADLYLKHFPVGYY